MTRRHAINLKILTLSILFIFFLILSSDNIKAEYEELYGDNYYEVLAANNIDNVYVISETGDIYKQFANYLKMCSTADSLSMIYFPSGEYSISNCKNIMLCSNIFIVGEENSIIKNNQTSCSMIRAAQADEVKNVTFYGGVWDGNSKGSYVFALNNTDNVKFINTSIINSATHGMYLNTCTDLYMSGCVLCDNAGDGTFIRRNSTSTIINCDILDNKGHGIQISQSSLNTEYSSKQNNFISGNAWSGISGTGDTSKINICGNIFFDNGVNPKKSGDSLVGHGVGVSEKCTAIISNNIMNDNSQCGISVFNGGNAEINNNEINNNGRHGIGARLSTAMTLNNNKIHNNKYNGILVSDEAVATISNTDISGSKKYGISIVDNSEVTISNTKVSNSAYSNITLTKGNESKGNSSLVLMSNNTISDSKSEYGIAIIDGNTVTVKGSGNKIYRNKSDGIRITALGTLKSSKASRIEVSGNGRYGINMSGGTISIANGLICSKNTTYGIYAMYGNKLVLKNSFIQENNGTGVYTFCTKVQLSGCMVKKNSKNGIRADYKSKLSLTNCTVTSNAENGVICENESTLASAGNIISSNKQCGILIADKSTATLTKTIVRNNSSDNISLSKLSAGKAGSYLKLKSNNTIYGSKTGSGINSKDYSFIRVIGSNNRIYKNKLNGIAMSGNGSVTTSSAAELRINSNKKNGIYANNSTLTFAKNISCSKNRQYGIYVTNHSKVSVKRGDFNANKKAGIYIKNSYVKTILNSKFTGNAKYGIVLKNSDIYVIKKNTLSNKAAKKQICIINCTGNYKKLSKRNTYVKD